MPDIPLPLPPPPPPGLDPLPLPCCEFAPADPGREIVCSDIIDEGAPQDVVM